MSIENTLKSLEIIDLPSEYLAKIKARESVLKFLDAPRPYRDYECTYDGSVYVSQQRMMDKFLLVADHYTLTIGEFFVDTQIWAVGCDVTIRCSIFGVPFEVTQHGVATVNMKRNENSPKGDAIEQAKKAAVSDGMKKVLSWLGVDAHIFRGEITSVKPQYKDGKPTNRKYMDLIQRYQLSEYNFPNGIPILPDSFKPYYQKMEWNGIFHSDAFKRKPTGSPSNAETRSTDPSQGKEDHKSGTGSTDNNDQTLKFINRTRLNLIRNLSKELYPGKSEEEVMQEVAYALGDEFNAFISRHKVKLNSFEKTPEKYAPQIINWFNKQKQNLQRTPA
jgi:hypothetical protein